jgi:hypothetical protein
MRTTRDAAPFLLSLVVACATVTGCNSNTDPIAAELDDRYPSTSASDWVTYADFAAVVTVAAEESGSPNDEELERGEGDIDRAVVFSVDSVVWQKEGASAAPTDLEYAALGWQFGGGDAEARRPMISEDRPRLEVGETYVMAFAWQPRVCYEGDGVIPGHWNGLGYGSVLPYADETVGVGEFAGDQRSLEEAQKAAESLPTDSIAAQTVGQDASAVRALLDVATPSTIKDFGSAPSEC